MELFKINVDSISVKDKRKILFQGAIIFDIIACLLFLFSLTFLVANIFTIFIILLIISLVLIIIGIHRIFWSEEEKRNYIISKLFAKNIKAQKKNGINITKDDYIRLRFECDPIYQKYIIQKVHKNDDAKYNARVQQYEAKKQDLQNKRASEIKRITNARWESISGGWLKFNMTEGKVIINQSAIAFSNIQGAELNIINSYRVETYENGTSKKHVSLGGAIAGGIILGPIGAVAGGIGLGKKKSNSTSMTYSIPTCSHLGVNVNINGFISEIIMISGLVDQSSHEYLTMQRYAQEIISKLRLLSQTPVPKSFMKVEEEPSIVDLNKKIEKSIQELKFVKEDTPKYLLPKKYLPNPEINIK